MLLLEEPPAPWAADGWLAAEEHPAATRTARTTSAARVSRLRLNSAGSARPGPRGAAACLSRCRAARRRRRRRRASSNPLRVLRAKSCSVGLGQHHARLRATTTAAIRWPHSSSGTPTTAHSVDVGVLEQHLLDLGRRDVLAAPDDRVVAATLDEEVAVVVDPAAVAGGEPALGVERRGDAGVLPRHLLAPNPDLTRSRPPASAARRRGSRSRRSAAPGPPRTRRVDGRPDRRRWASAMVVGAEHGDGRARLGQPVGVGEVDLGQQRHHPLRARWPASGHRRRTVARRPGSPSPSLVEDVADAGQHGRHDHGVRDAFAAHRRRPSPAASNWRR